MQSSRGVFQKAGYVTYPGMFKGKEADNLSFQNGGNFQVMQVAIAIYTQNMTCSGVGYMVLFLYIYIYIYI